MKKTPFQTPGRVLTKCRKIVRKISMYKLKEEKAEFYNTQFKPVTLQNTIAENIMFPEESRLGFQPCSNHRKIGTMRHINGWFCIHCTKFSSYYNFLNTPKNLINLELLESLKRVDYYNGEYFFKKRRKVENIFM